MNGWGGEVARVVETALAELSNLTKVEPREQLLKAGYFWVEASGAEVEGGEEGISIGNDIYQIRETASISICVLGADKTSIDLFPVFRAARKALSEAVFEDVLVEPSRWRGISNRSRRGKTGGGDI